MAQRIGSAFRRFYPSIVATVALVVALVGVPGVTAGGLLVTTKNVKNNSLTSADIKKSTLKTSDIGTNAVRTADIQDGAIESTDIGNGEVTPEDVTMPAPTQCKVGGEMSIQPTLEFQKIADLCTFTKVDPSSVVETTWTGSVLGENGGELSGCVFQLRLDGNPAPGGSGEVFGKGIVSVSSAAVFPAATAAPHTVSVWAKVTVDNAAPNKCTVGPQNAGIGQTVVAEEKIL